MSSESKKILVLSVDRDDDVGAKAGVSTPVVGRKHCLEAGTKLILADPEEADANAIYAAVAECDGLNEKGYECEVAILSGSPDSGFEADQRMLRQARAVISSVKPDGVVLVSDGFEDERVLPILQGIVPIISVKRVVIKHSASVEETYQVLGRYLKMLVYEPRYSKYVLGIPGILLILYGIFAFFKLYTDFAYIFTLVLGGMFILRGFGIDNLFSRARRRTFFHARFFAFLASLMILIVAIMQGYNALTALPGWNVIASNSNLLYQNLGLIIGTFVEHALLLIWLAIAVNVSVDTVFHVIRKSVKMARDLIALAALVLMYSPVFALAALFENPTRSPLPVISLLLAGLAVILVLIYLFYGFYSGRRVSTHESG
ncbi:MAG: DUF373 family protein [Nitrososphaerota archaeon]|nr:DUF373 family protein [Nitrososphaerota archaeon]